MHLIGKIKDITTADKRYPAEAYFFIMDALRFTVNHRKKRGHVSARQLLEGTRDYAKDEFGLMACEVLKHWGITRTDDFGEIVFNLVENEVWSKTEDDQKEDFHQVFDFEETFNKQNYKFIS